MEFFALIFLVVAITFLAEKTRYRLLNFGSFLILLYLGLTSDNVWLLAIFILLGLLILAYSIFGSDD